MKDIRQIKKVDKNGNVIKVIDVDWNKKGEYEVY